MGDCEAETLVFVESPLKYHPLFVWRLIRDIRRQCLVGSLTGVVASKRVTEAPKGTLSTVGNRA